MNKRCEEVACKKVATSIYKDKRVCKFHRCRCNDPNVGRNYFTGCHIHEK